jgi:aminoglycoside phosphotransferase (APT) family kinase protein
MVAKLVASQFPQWSRESLMPVVVGGWDNTTFRLGSNMSVRLPNDDAYVPQVEKEHRWLSVLAPQLPVPIPQPLAKGAPTEDFPRPWSVYRWLDGVTASVSRVADLDSFAVDLGIFLAALYSCDVQDAPAAGAHSFFRGGPVATWDVQVHELLQAADGMIDVEAARDVWNEALHTRNACEPVWVHGDITGSNILVVDGKLAAVIDFGCSAVGDPACDTTIAWTSFFGSSRAAFMATVPVDAATWARGRGWVLWKALLHLVDDGGDPRRGEETANRLGWRLPPSGVIHEVVADHREAQALG